MLLVEKLGAFFCAVKFNAESSAKVECSGKGNGNNDRKGKIYKDN